MTSARALAFAQRRASAAAGWRMFRAERAGMAGLVILVVFAAVALLAPILAAESGLDVTRADGPGNAGPSLDYPFGTDKSGRSVLTLVIWGSRISLLVGLLATVLSMVIGTVVGVLAGHFRGASGAGLMRLTDWFLVIPFLPLAIVLQTILGPSLTTTVVVIGLTSWPGTARLIWAQTLAVESRPYLERARALGAGHWHQMSRHVLPNVMPMVFANTILTVAIAILSESTLSFLGLGDPIRISWGTVLEQAFDAGAVSAGNPWWLLAPGLGIVAIVLAFTLCGRALESVLNPALRER
ncbi:MULTISPECIES: ABC transporter permease [unclassified Streptosporangium]|uniref:ABC transporter permease n=1 Tax=Streptosporangium sp. NPDC005286 TaxID=3154463 RepID=UPI0033B09EAA